LEEKCDGSLIGAEQTINHKDGTSIERPNGDIGRRYVRFPNRLGGLSVTPSKNYLGLLGCIGLWLRALILGWGPWWLLMGSVHNPKGKPWTSCLLFISPTQM
jgi:hypothetical protein